MLSDKLKENYIASQNIELRTKATSFKNLSRAADSKKDLGGLLEKISEYIKKQPDADSKEVISNEVFSDEEISIVDNPEDITFELPNFSDIASDDEAPFFKSVGNKLTKIYG